MDDQNESGATARRRRSSAEIKLAILSGAREEFAERTYSAARTQSIAKRAHVAENQIFDHFGSKQALFREAVLTPVEEFMSTWAETVSTATWGERSADVELTEYLVALTRMLLEERGILAAYFASVSLDSDAVREATGPTGWSEALSRTDDLAVKFARAYGLILRDTRQQVRLTLASIVGVVLLGDFFLEREFEPEQIANALAHQLLYGFASAEAAPRRL